jgi:hypothetical protein
MNGVLPIGEYYLEVEINIGNPVVEVGVAAPPTATRLVRVVPIFSDGAPELDIEYKLRAAAETNDAVQLDAILREYGKNDVGLQRSRWRFLSTAIRNRTLTTNHLSAIGEHIVTSGILSLDALEQELTLAATTRLDRLLVDTPDLSDEAGGQVYRTIKNLKARAAVEVEEPGGPAPTVLPIGRSAEISEVRSFGTKGKERLLLLTGLEGVGKSAIVAAALAQAGTRQLRVVCVPGMSADSIFEYLIRSGDRIATGHAPRSTFSLPDLV